MRAFEGVKVVDLTHVLAGPFCTYQLALLGADVIKIEEPIVGDYMRGRGSDDGLRDERMGDHFLCQNANKRSLALDLKSAECINVVRHLVSSADVVVSNFRGDALDGLGLDSDSLCDLNSKLVYCRLTAYGCEGPMGHLRAYDNVVQAMAGMMMTTGTPESGPLKAGTPVLDYATGAMAAFAISSALFARHRTGRGRVLDVSMMDTAFLMMSPSIMSWLTSGRKTRPHGNDHALASASCYETADGSLLMLGCCTQLQFETLCRLIGRDDLLRDERFARVRHQDPFRTALVEELANTMRERTAFVWEGMLIDDVPVARVRTLEEALELPQVSHRSVLGKFPDWNGQAGDSATTVPQMAFVDPEDPASIERPPPRLGEHTREILHELGISEASIDCMIKDGIAMDAGQ